MNNTSRFNVICGGRRGGKSGMIEHLIYRKPGGNVLEGNQVALFGISSNTMTELWRECVNTGGALIKSKDESARRLDFHGGGVLELWTLKNYDFSRGRRYHRSITDEAAIHPNFASAWDLVLRAQLIDYRGDAFFLSTPNGFNNKFHDLYMNAVRGVPSWKSFRFPTSANPRIEKEEIEIAKKELPDLYFRQEFLAEFVNDNEERWLYSYDQEEHLVDNLPYMRSFPVYLSFDFNASPVSCIAVQRGGDRFIHFIKEFTGNMQLRDLCDIIKLEYGGNTMFITGDASGNRKDVGFSDRNQTYYTMIKEYLGVGGRQLNLNTKNLLHNDSRLLCNIMFRQKGLIKIDRFKCPSLVNDIEMSEVDIASGVPGRLKKDRNRYKMDMFDAMRYHFQTYDLKKIRKYKIQED